MEEKKLIRYGSFLRKKAKDVKSGSETDKLIEEMKKILQENEGVGLAAPQIGVSQRVIVVDTGKEIYPFLNPKILKVSEEKITTKEGCLSLKGIWLDVLRFKKVKVEAENQEGEKILFDAEGIPAVIFQHEIDHLNGKLFIDRVGFFERMKALFSYYFKNDKPC
jgi:peptide deformylase